MIAICSDLHGNQNHLAEIIQKVKVHSSDEENYVLCCGDWGFLFENSYAEQRFLDDLEAQEGIRFLFLDGNHENHPALNCYPVREWKGGQTHSIRKNVLHLMRGEVFDIDGRRFFIFGGAATPDFDRKRREKMAQTTGKQLWWAEEVPGKEEMTRGMKNLAAVKFQVDFILTHTAPTSIAAQMGFNAVQEEAEFADYLEQIRMQTAFDKWFFGHFHKDWRAGPFTCLWHNIEFL